MTKGHFNSIKLIGQNFLSMWYEELWKCLKFFSTKMHDLLNAVTIAAMGVIQ